MNSAKRGPIVVKVGGSLFDLPDLGPRLRRWLKEQGRGPTLLVPGGGPAADVVREYDRWHRLGEERAHWLALRALTLNAHFLAALLSTDAVVLTEVRAGARQAWDDRVSILDPSAFAQADEGQPGSLPHCWSITSDSLAARVAQVVAARELLLLKSASLPAGIDWTEAGKRGLVDTHFAEVVGSSLAVRFVNFRADRLRKR